MGGLRLGFGLGLGFPTHRAASKGPLCDAMAKGACVSAKNKKRELILAPHVVYSRDGGQRVAAVIVEQDGKAPNKPKLSTFKVSDLSEITVLDRAFTSEPGFDPNGSEYGNEIICVVQMV